MDFDWSKLDRIDDCLALSEVKEHDTARVELGALRREIANLLSSWRRTSDAQAEAVVTSAMLTTELEETQERLKTEILVRSRAEATFQSLLRLTSAATGASYFEKLSEGLAEALEPAFVLVAQIDGESARTLGAWAHGKIVGGFSYDLEGTPCAKVSGGVSCIHDSGVQALYPDDELLIEMGIESYLGVPLRRPDGTVLGLIIVLDTKPRRDLARGLEIVELFADRAGVELVRLETDRHLIEAKEAAEDASRTKSSFLAMISHEIRTPLNGILGMTSVLLHEPELSADHRGLVDTTHRSGQVLLRVLNDVLDFSKIEAGELEIVDDDFDPEQLVEEVLALYDHGGATSTIACAAWAEPEVPARVLGDETRIRQVLGNLVGNATKFTTEGEIRVVARSVDDGGGIEFEVSDTGIGIDRRAQTRIFEPFSQADGSMSRRFGGTGLGLSICRQLVEMMGGEIGFESELGKGSRFWFRLPLDTRGAVPRDTEIPPVRLHVAVAASLTRQALIARLSRLGVDFEIVPSVHALVQVMDASSPRDPLPKRAFVVDLDLVQGDEDAFLVAARESDGGQALIALGSTTAWWSHKQGRRDFSGVLTLPLRSAQIKEVLRGLSPELAIDAPTGSCRPMKTASALEGCRVLLVEDNPVNRLVATRMLQRFGCEVEEACNGLECLQSVDSGDFDAILMDCQMPVMDGYEATQRILETRKNGEPHVPIIAMTANAMRGDRERCLDAGMDDYLSKPIHSEKLQEVLEQWFAPGRGTRIAAADAGVSSEG